MNRRNFVTTAITGTMIGITGCLRDGGRPTEVDEDDPTDPNQLPNPTIGDGDVTFEVFTDYSCQFCQSFAMNLQDYIIDEYANEGIITYTHRDFPIPVNDWSLGAANSARYIQDELGEESFWEYKRELLTNISQYNMTFFINTGEEFGADTDGIRNAINEGTYNPVINADRTYGIENGVTGTPAIYIEGELVEDPMDIDEIDEMIQNAQ